MGQELVPVSAVSLAALVPGTQRSPELGTTGRRLDIDTITLHTLHTGMEKSVGEYLFSFAFLCSLTQGIYFVPRQSNT